MIEALLLASNIADLYRHLESQSKNEIIVTGERIARTQHETISSVAVHTADIIEAQAAPDRVEQLLQTVPNVQLGSGGEGPSIRGQDSTGVVRDLLHFLAGAGRFQDEATYSQTTTQSEAAADKQVCFVRHRTSAYRCRAPKPD